MRRLGKGSVATITGKKMPLPAGVSRIAAVLRVEAYRRMMKSTVTTTVSTFCVQCSALRYALTKQYKNAATHKNDSRKAATKIGPMRAIETI